MPGDAVEAAAAVVGVVALVEVVEERTLGVLPGSREEDDDMGDGETPSMFLMGMPSSLVFPSSAVDVVGGWCTVGLITSSSSSLEVAVAVVSLGGATRLVGVAVVLPTEEEDWRCWCIPTSRGEAGSMLASPS